MEDHARALPGDPAPAQGAAGVARDVLDAEAGVDVPPPVAEQHAGRGERRAFAFQADIEFVAGKSGAEFEVDTLVGGVAGQHGVGAQEGAGAGGIVLQAHVVQPRTRGHVHVRQGVGEVRMHARGQLVLDQGEARAAADLDEVAQVPGGIGRLRRADQHQVDRSPGIDVVVDSQDRAVVGQRRVEAGEGFVGARVAALQEVGVARARFAQGAGDRQQLDAGRQPGQVAGGGVETAIDEHQPRRGDRGQHGRVQRDRVGRREAAAFERAQRGVLPGLAARAGQAVAQHVIKRRAAGRVAGETRGQRVEQGAHLSGPRPAQPGP